ncbi:hypothetical protein L208DRAFT_1230699, partial [Tricholoma matsutake]
NMAEAIWETLVMYGIEGRVVVVTYNALNNNMFVDGIEHHAKNAGVPFNAFWACLCCMPHKIHLAVIKLLKGIGTVLSAEGKKAASHAGNYQDASMASLDCDLDNGEGDQANLAVSGHAVDPDQSKSILSLVDKVLPY